MNSSHKQGRKNLVLGVISKVDAERLLTDWANLPDLPKSMTEFDEVPDSVAKAYYRLLDRHPRVFGPIEGRGKSVTEDGIPPTSSTCFHVRTWRDRLRLAWAAEDRRRREWHLFALRLDYHRELGIHALPSEFSTDQLMSLLWTVPPITALEAALFYLSAGIGDRARVCRGPGCPARYFIAKKRWQRYCSEVCALPAQQEAKRKWWRENRAKGAGLL